MQLVVHPLLKSNPFQQLLGIGAIQLGGQHHRHFYIFQCRQIRQQIARIVLPDEADGIAFVLDQLIVGNLEQIPRTDSDLTRGRPVKPSKNIQQASICRCRCCR